MHKQSKSSGCKVHKRDKLYHQGFYKILETLVSTFMTLRPVMENFIKYFMPEVMATKTGPQCKDRLERDMPSNTFCHGHLYVYNLIQDGKGTKLFCENL